MENDKSPNRTLRFQQLFLRFAKSITCKSILRKIRTNFVRFIAEKAASKPRKTLMFFTLFLIFIISSWFMHWHTLHIYQSNELKNKRLVESSIHIWGKVGNNNNQAKENKILIGVNDEKLYKDGNNIEEEERPIQRTRYSLFTC